MQTTFSLAQLLDPQVYASEKILRACVHCGFCTATCPTYVLLGDELDSPRGRIYLIKEMFEHGRPATGEVVKHIDRCLSCLACMTTCPSGVHYMHLVDHAREHIEKTYKRPLFDRLIRSLLAHVLTDPALFRLAAVAGWIAKPLAPMLRAVGFTRMAAMLRLTPSHKLAPPAERSGKVYPASGPRRGRVALLAGCINPVLAPSTNEAAIRMLNRHGIEVVVARGEACCGSLVHHMGREDQALAQARNNIDAWTREIEGQGLDAILITVSGCGTTVKDYGFMLRTDSAYAVKAARISALARDVTEYLSTINLKAAQAPARLTVAYHSACSLQHGQKVTREPKELLSKFGFVVKDVPEGHLCCGSAGTYNILQPELAERLRDRKVANIERLQPDVIAAGNIGCITQIATGTAIPVVHTVELLDWATGGPVPKELAGLVGLAPAAVVGVRVLVEPIGRTDHGEEVEEVEGEEIQEGESRPGAQEEGAEEGKAGQESKG
jgi:glycolate oxidase iron-sulfur subunit